MKLICKRLVECTTTATATGTVYAKYTYHVDTFFEGHFTPKYHTGFGLLDFQKSNLLVDFFITSDFS